MTPAGDRHHRVAFERRSVVADDGYGNTTGPWTQQCVRWASMTPIRRGEAVMASRLTGVQPYAIVVLADSDTREITTAWRARLSGRTFNIRTVEPSPDRAEISMLVEEGVADG